MSYQEDRPQASTTPTSATQKSGNTGNGSFWSKGAGDHSKVKDYFSVLAPPIPLDQVYYHKTGCGNNYNDLSTPGLHISLGVFYRLFDLLEIAVNKLDFQVAQNASLHPSNSTNLDLSIM